MKIYKLLKDTGTDISIDLISDILKDSKIILFVWKLIKY